MKTYNVDYKLWLQEFELEDTQFHRLMYERAEEVGRGKAVNPDAVITHTRNEILKKWNEVLEQREEILSAFIAKYNLQPEETEQVVENQFDKIVWYPRRKGETNVNKA